MTHDTTKAPPSVDEVVHARPHYKGGGADQALIDDPDAAFAAIETFAKGGKGDAVQVVHLARSLPFEHKAQVEGLMGPLEKRLSGEQMLQLGVLVGVSASVTLKHALHSRPAIRAEQLREHLRGMSPAEIANIADDNAVFTAMRKLLPGPLISELPALIDMPAELHSKPPFVKWYLASTDKTVAALALGRAGTSALAKTLDGLSGWGWLGDLAVARNYYDATALQELHDGTGDAGVKAKITHMLGGFDPEKYTSKVGDLARDEVDQNVKNHGSTADLLDDGARASNLNVGQHDLAAKRLAGESADTILQFATAAQLEPAHTIPLLATAPGVNAEKMRYYLATLDDVMRYAMLADDKLRSMVRKVIGVRTQLFELFPTVDSRESVHEFLFVKDDMKSAFADREALRQWAYQDKRPETYLWLAAGSKLATESCKIVKREVGFGWVRSLPLTAPMPELRRLALNCDDPTTADYVHEHLLGDRAYKVKPFDNKVVEPSSDVYGEQAPRRLTSELAKKAESTERPFDPALTLARLGDLDSAQRAAVLANPSQLQQIFTELSAGDDLVRAVFLLGPTVSQLLSIPVSYQPGLLDYIGTRSEDEQRAALQQPAVVANAKTMFRHTGPYVVFPVLYEPRVLAKALQSAPALLEWLLDQTDSSFALAVLSVEPVRKVAIQLLEQRPTIYDKLPAFKNLLPQGRQGFDALTSASKNEDKQAEADEYKAGHARVDDRADLHAERMQHATAQGPLWSALDALYEQQGTQDSALALVNNASASERVALLTGDHEKSCEKLRKMAPISAFHVFPGMSAQQLLALPGSGRWILQNDTPYAVLSRLGWGAPAFKSLAHALERDMEVAHIWIATLPDSAGLTAQERVGLDMLAGQLSKDSLLRELFERRFGGQVDGTFGTGELKRLWTVLKRLPASQVNQHVIERITHVDLGATASGEWAKPAIALHENPKELAGNEQSYEDSDVLSADEIKKFYGLDDESLAVAANPTAGWIEKTSGGYRVKPITTTPQFDATVIHEVGHSVDTLLGEHTSLIYDQAGWKAYGVDQFSEWAEEMGALKGVEGPVRERVIEAFTESLRAGKPVNQMVDAQHPALGLASTDPLAKAAQGDSAPLYYKGARHEAHGGKVFLTNSLTLYSVKQTAAQVAPSEYSMSAPAEYFAECYVEYYREYKGTPDTASKKGGHLATWIKKWFDENVDRVRLAPDRLKPPAAAKPDPGSKKPKTA